MFYRLGLCLIALCLSFQSYAQLGTWRDHLNYSNAFFLDVLGDEVFVASSNGIFIYHRENNDITRLNKTTGLSDISITALEASEERGTVLVGYENGNLDIIRGKTITNFPAIKNSSVVGDKSIRHIYFSEGQAYLSTGIGIISVNLERTEVSDTYEILPTGPPAMNEVTVLNDTMFAATDEGLFKASLLDDLTIFANWGLDMTVPAPFTPANNVSAVAGNLFVNYREGEALGTFVRRPEGWVAINGGGDVLQLTESPQGLVVNTSYFVDAKNLNGFSSFILNDYGNGTDFRAAQAVWDDQENVWIADAGQGLIKYNETSGAEVIAVIGPGTNNAFKLELNDGRLWVASGSPQHPGNWNNSSDFSKRGFYKLHEGQWENYTLPEYSVFIEESFSDVAIAYPHPGNPDFAYVGSWQGGMLTAENGEIIKLFDETNSSLEVREEFSGFIGVSDIKADSEGNIWVLNGYADEPLSVLRPDETWESFDLNGNFGPGDILIRAVVSQEDKIWMAHNRKGVVVFDPTGPNPENVKTFKTGAGNGGLPTDEVYTLTEDLDGEIWVGTADGIAVFYSPFDAFSADASDARQILVEQDGIFQFLLEAQSVSAIAVDGANRKWIGTFGSGVFLLSEDGTEEILRFTAEQSPLFSNIIYDIVVDDITGEVFIATEEGLLSYQGDATGGGLSNECTTVYPNPVRETYSGPITIEGLVRNSDIQITDTRGNLVNTLESNGGRAIWNGKNINGERVATGVYFALSSDETGESTCVSKILMIK